MKGRTQGDGDWCPQDEAHGRMYAYSEAQTQFCPHSAHKGNALYGWDGVTPKHWATVMAPRTKQRGAHV